jgi:hypothetical protein
VVVIHRRATNLNLNTLLLQAKKMIGLELTISEFLQTVSLFHQSLLTTLNTPNKMVTLPIREHTNKIHIELLQDLTEMTEAISRIMVEVVHNIWLLASLPPDKEPQLHADIAEDAR